MDTALLLFGRLGGFVGILITLIASAMRVTGHYSLGSFQLSTLLVVGIAGMVFGCFCLLAVLTSQLPQRR